MNSNLLFVKVISCCQGEERECNTTELRSACGEGGSIDLLPLLPIREDVRAFTETLSTLLVASLPADSHESVREIAADIGALGLGLVG